MQCPYCAAELQALRVIMQHAPDPRWRTAFLCTCNPPMDLPDDVIKSANWSPMPAEIRLVSASEPEQ